MCFCNARTGFGLDAFKFMISTFRVAWCAEHLPKFYVLLICDVLNVTVAKYLYDHPVGDKEI